MTNNFPLQTVSSEIKVHGSPVKILISKGSDYILIMISQNSKLGNFTWSDPFSSLLGDSGKSLTSQIYSSEISQILTSPFLLCLSLDSYVDPEENLEKQGILLKEIILQISRLMQEF